MKKKVVGCILTAMMITGMFTGCGNSESQSGDGTNTGSGDQVVVDIFQNKMRSAMRCRQPLSNMNLRTRG